MGLSIANVGGYIASLGCAVERMVYVSLYMLEMRVANSIEQ
jgi:hypothetical protein